LARSQKLEISFSQDQFDQWRLGQAGGSIGYVKGKLVFQFESRDQYNKYLELYSHRFRQAK
jgi:hypothetical protein